MSTIEIRVPANGARRWQAVVAERLRERGHKVSLRAIAAPTPWGGGMDAVLRLERRLLRSGRDGLAQRTELVPDPAGNNAEVTLDLAGADAGAGKATLALRFDGAPHAGGALPALLGGRAPSLALVAPDGAPLLVARPMIDQPALLGSALEDVLARAITLAVTGVERELAGRLAPVVLPAPTGAEARTAPPLLAYGTDAVPRLLREVVRRARFRSAHWRVGFRFHPGPGVAETGELGSGWSVVPDDGSRFLADPFPAVFNGRHVVFVEDFPHRTGKGVISAISFDGHAPGPPVPVLEEPYHLSYPQVFFREEQHWMLPESSAGRVLKLYRAEHFPLRWAEAATLLAGREISDATLLERDGRLWLFATERDGFGSTSDTMVVFSAERMEGPWIDHHANPILIDRAAARPGGAFVESGGRTFLPVQDGTTGYGGGLGLAELLVLNHTEVRFAPPVPISASGDWPYPRIHTLNRAGALEVIDGIAAVPR